jgi:hypothetical protein
VLTALKELYCDMHAVGQQSTVETFITVAKQRINTQQWKRPAFSMGSGPAQCGSVFFGVRPRGYITRVFKDRLTVRRNATLTL